MLRNRITQILLSVGFVVLVVQVVLIAPNEVKDVDSRASVIPTPDMGAHSDMDQSMSGIHMIETQEGKKEWELWSEQAVSLKTKDQLQLKQPKSIFFAEKGTTFTVTGNTGQVQSKTKNMRVQGKVTMRSSNGYTFRTDGLDYRSDTRELSTSDPVAVSGPKENNRSGLRLTGFGMRSSVSDGTMEVLREVVADRDLDRGRVRIRSQRAVFSSQDKMAKFIGEVVLDMQEMRITGPEAIFKYGEKSGELESVVFTGGARVSDSEKWATAQNLRVDLKSNRFVFWGNPRVVQNNDELRGEEIIFIDGGKRVQVKGARAKVNQNQLEKVN